MTKWTEADLPDQSNRTYVITGANSGLGLVAARELARVGAHVIMAVRTVAKGEEAARTITGSTDVRKLDLASLSSVRDFAAGLTGPVDVLINNAGIMMPPKGTTADGFETQMGTNHFGHFALTNLLLPQITDRVVTTSSMAHRGGKIDFDDLDWTSRSYNRVAAYGQSKLANLLFTRELQHKLTAVGSSVRSVASHPGYSATNLQSHWGNPVMDVLMSLGNSVFAQSATAGTRPTLYASVTDIPGDTYIGPDGFNEVRGYPKRVGRSKAADNAATAARLWEVSEERTGVRFPLAPTPS